MEDLKKGIEEYLGRDELNQKLKEFFESPQCIVLKTPKDTAPIMETGHDSSNNKGSIPIRPKV